MHWVIPKPHPIREEGWPEVILRPEVILHPSQGHGMTLPVQTVHSQRDEATAGDGQGQEDAGHGVDLALRGPLQVGVVGRRLEHTGLSLNSEMWPNAGFLFEQ